MPPRRHILIVEDDQFLRKACHDALTRDGFEVVSVRDGEEALRKVAADPPDVMVLDWVLPTLPGLEVLRAVKADARSHGMPVLVLTNSSRDEDRERALEAGAAGFLIKADLSLHDLRLHIKHLLSPP